MIDLEEYARRDEFRLAPDNAKDLPGLRNVTSEYEHHCHNQTTGFHAAMLNNNQRFAELMTRIGHAESANEILKCGRSLVVRKFGNRTKFMHSAFCNEYGCYFCSQQKAVHRAVQFAKSSALFAERTSLQAELPLYHILIKPELAETYKRLQPRVALEKELQFFRRFRELLHDKMWRANRKLNKTTPYRGSESSKRRFIGPTQIALHLWMPESVYKGKDFGTNYRCDLNHLEFIPSMHAHFNVVATPRSKKRIRAMYLEIRDQVCEELKLNRKKIQVQVLPADKHDETDGRFHPQTIAEEIGPNGRLAYCLEHNRSVSRMLYLAAPFKLLQKRKRKTLYLGRRKATSVFVRTPEMIGMYGRENCSPAYRTWSLQWHKELGIYDKDDTLDPETYKLIAPKCHAARKHLPIRDVSNAQLWLLRDPDEYSVHRIDRADEPLIQQTLEPYTTARVRF